MLAAREVPVTLCALWLGAVVDRVGGYKTTLIALSLSALAVGSISFDTTFRPLLVVSYVLLGCGMVLIAPTVGIYLPNLVEDADLEQANGVFQVAYASANLIQMGGSAHFILSHRFAEGFLLDAGSYVTAMATIVAIGPIVSMGQNVDQEDEQGLVPVGLLGIGRWLLRLFDARRELLAMVVINGAMYFAQGAVVVLLPRLLVQQLHSGFLYSWVMVATGVADLLAGMASAWFLARLPIQFRSLAYGFMAALNGLTLLLITIAPTASVIVIAMFFGSVFLEMLYVLYVTQVQRSIPQSAMGRYETLSAGYSSVIMGLGTVSAGLLRDVLGGFLVVSAIAVVIPLTAGSLGHIQQASSIKRLRSSHDGRRKPAKRS